MRLTDYAEGIKNLNMMPDIAYHFARFFPDEAIQPFAFLLAQKMREGHICLPVSDEPVKTDLGEVSLRALQNAGPNICAQGDAVVPFIFHPPHLYLQRYYRYETQVIEWIKGRIVSGREKRETYREMINRHGQLIRSLRAGYPLDGLNPEEKTDWQLVAVIRALVNDFGILTGGPGTGKTTTLAKLLRIVFTENPESRVALAAPTGKASMRMLESLRQKSAGYPEEIKEKIQQLQPFTLHRLLGYQRHSIYFRHHQDNPLPYDWVMVDEASMIDLPMFAKLLSACGPSTRLLLLGDKDQLASVEAGSLLGDLCLAAGKLNLFPREEITWLNKFIDEEQRRIASSHESAQPKDLAGCITELKLSHRFKQQGAIGQLSLALNRGLEEEAMQLLQQDTTGQIRLTDPDDEETFNEFISGYQEYLHADDVSEALTAFHNLRVLVTVREGDSGLYALNRKIEKALHARYPRLIKPASGFYHNQPVIITANNYELNLFNGDIGIVRKDPATGKLRVWFEAEEQGKGPRSFSPASLNDYETVFAMTIHKSQGSEFRQVMVVLPDNPDNPLLTRELLYTGVTRAISNVIIRGSADSLGNGIRQQVKRISGITSRLNA